MTLLTNPRQTILVSSRSNVEVMGKNILKDNLIAVDWHMPVSMVPLIYAVSIGTNKFSRKLISSSKSFAVNFMPFSQAKAVLFCGRNSGEHIDKFKESGLSKIECTSIDCARVKEACGFVECELLQEIEVGDHIIFVGKVNASDILTDERKLFHLSKDSFTTTKD